MITILLLIIANVKSQSQTFCSEGCKIFTDATECDQLRPLCSWRQETKTCIKGYIKPQINIYPSQITQFCSQNKDQCSITYGCSYYNNICTRFLGCDAYQSYSEEDCLNISYLCIWDNTKQGCVRSPDYDSKGGLINQRACSAAGLAWRSKEGCPKYSSQCIFNGIFCVEALGSCSQYQTTKENCQKLIGGDGQCTQSDSATNCMAKTCGMYQTSQCKSYRSDCFLDRNSLCQQKQRCVSSNATKKSQCQNKIEQDCYFDGKSCTLVPLQYCSEYSKSQCKGSVGKDGICILEKDQCVKLDCQNDKNQQQYRDLELYEDYCQSINVCEQKNEGCYQIGQEGCKNIMKISTDCLCYKCIVNKQECLFASTQLECVQNQQSTSTIPCYWNEDKNYCQFATRCSQLSNQSSCLQLKPSCVYRNNNCVDLIDLDCPQIYNDKNGDQILQKYCLQNRGCAIFNSKCITLFLSCDNYTSEATCYKDILNQPCVWNYKTSKCLNYKERQGLLQIECELMSDYYIYQDGTCQMKKSCVFLNETQIGLEGSCAQYKLDQIKSSITACSELDDNLCLQFDNICKKVKINDTKNSCQNLECRDLTSTQCKPIKGFKLQDYKYCRLFGDICLEVLPTNQKDCLLYSAGSKFFHDKYCVSCKRNDECKIQQIYSLQVPTNENFQSKLSIIMIIFYILIIQ
ncbi:unnamed protein product (macronuclear) [Paramecium tetraurelia]|uniref:Transmembrane protein n=1 Tax=Paramecium tetraurelia TaxID=5888 RepID=A0DUD4_PARTE|nr:uncharacterized protein GSPATT00020323001 [Paramecium tetraurelia]CAK86651.1 unnamed protein product [Paramecium tetraurelia]|eukprot:XP_001454048.1 hypothetical protein (macronuclear) [Paramecium tetraurelia strain d4-2]